MFKRGDGFKLASIAFYLTAGTLISVAFALGYIVALYVAVVLSIFQFIFAIVGQKRAYSSLGMVLFVSGIVLLGASVTLSILGNVIPGLI